MSYTRIILQLICCTSQYIKMIIYFVFFIRNRCIQYDFPTHTYSRLQYYNLYIIYSYIGTQYTKSCQTLYIFGIQLLDVHTHSHAWINLFIYINDAIRDKPRNPNVHHYPLETMERFLSAYSLQVFLPVLILCALSLQSSVQ